MKEGYSELLVVEDTFEFTGRGLVLFPDFDIPTTGWMNSTVSDLVIVVTSSGDEKLFDADLKTVHFNIQDPGVPVSRRWRIVVSLVNAQKDDVPIGSKVYGPAHIISRLFNGQE